MNRIANFFIVLSFFSCVSAQGSRTYDVKLNDETVKSLAIKKIEQCRLAKYKEQLPTDITYLAVDIKYDGEKLKILEFQDGPTAGFRAYDDVVKNRGEIWHDFWEHMSSYKLPMWYLGPEPKTYSLGVFSHNDKERVRFEEFLEMGGSYVPSWQELAFDSEFISAENRGVARGGEKRRRAISDYKGIILAKLCGQNYKISAFRRVHPDFLVINEWARKSLYDKRRVHMLFNKLGLDEYRPWSKLIRKHYSPRLARKIIKECPSDFYVVKPLNSSRSNGIIITKKKNLNVVLKKLFGTRSIDDFDLRSYRPNKTQVYGYWKGDTNKNFMIEEYVPSKNLTIKDKVYDPTARITFVVSHSAGNVNFSFLKGFWKVPPKALTDSGTLTDRHVSKHFEGIFDLPADAIRIGEEDMKHIEELLVKAMLPVYTAVLLGR